jgi:hypothetical protein
MPNKKTAPPVRANGSLKSEPQSASSRVLVNVKDNEIQATLDTRSYRLRGLEKNMSPHQLRVNILATRDDLVHMDTFDLCKARSRQSFIKATAEELFMDEQVIKKDIGKLLLELEQLREEQIDVATRSHTTKVVLTSAGKRAAMKLLRSPKLTDQILADFASCGLVGEETNKLLCYLACVSRLLKQPLAILIQSSSAAGKTSLMDATLAFVPQEDQIRYSAMTGQSLYYMGASLLKHKILAVAEEEGVAQASYALKLLQSDGRLRIAAAGKNNGTGRQQTESYEVEGPVMMLLTTTSETPDPELQSRCITLHVNESPDQTAAVHQSQRSAYTLEGQAAASQREKLTRLHQNAQRLLEPLPVVIPWADQLKFRHDQTRMRRDHAKYLALIASITLLHQHQRPKQKLTVDGETVEYLEATVEDAQLANRLASEVMGQTLDGLLPQTRQLLVLIDDYINQRSQDEKKPRSLVRFTQRQLREALGWGDYPLRRHLARLVALEYVLAYRTGAKNQREYQLLYEGQGRDGAKFLLGLADASKLKAKPTPQKGQNDHLASQNDAPSMPLRSVSDGRSITSKNGATGGSAKQLQQGNGKPTPKTNKGS